jgi:methyl-accepting chemotaxis protein
MRSVETDVSARSNEDGASLAIGEIADLSGNVGLTVIEVAGNVESVQHNVSEQVSLFQELTVTAEELRDGNDTLSEDAQAISLSTQAVTSEVVRSKEEMRNALEQVTNVTAWVGSTSDHLARLQSDMKGVGDIARHIDKIAQQTHVLALNAHIEASRSGAAGSGFTVIANSIRDLADQTIAAAASIGETLRPLVAAIAELSTSAAEARSGAEAAAAGTGMVYGALERSEGEMLQLDDRARQVAAFSTTTTERVSTFSTSLQTLFDGVDDSRSQIAAATARLSELLESAEGLVQLSVQAGVRTTDTPFVVEVLQRARQIESVLSQAVRAQQISLEDLFDERYVPIPNSDPVQFTTRFVTLTDSVLAPIQEEILLFSPLIVFAACVDRNGFLPTHNRKFSAPQGPDPLWNAANSRNRRIFDDPTGLAAAQSVAPFRLQTYRRELGGGEFRLMKDVSAPLHVAGRHWGALRIAYIVERRNGERRWIPPTVDTTILSEIGYVPPTRRSSQSSSETRFRVAKPEPSGSLLPATSER